MMRYIASFVFFLSFASQGYACDLCGRPEVDHLVEGVGKTPIMSPYYNGSGQTEPGYDLGRIALHEIGHAAIGLGHTFSSSSFILGPTLGKWGDPTLGVGANITYSFVPTGTTSQYGLMTSVEDFMGSAGLEEIREALRLWESVADVHFWEVEDWGVPLGGGYAPANMRIGFADISALGIGFYPSGPDRYQGYLAGEIIFSTRYSMITTADFLPFSPGDIAGAQFLYGSPLIQAESTVVPELDSGYLALMGVAVFLWILAIPKIRELRRRGK